MAYTIQLTSRAEAHGLGDRVLGQVTRTPVTEANRGDYLRAVDSVHPLSEGGHGYGAVLFATALVMCLVPAWQHVIFGLVSAACFFVPGLKYARQRGRGA
jgi:hypothetical protein